MAPKAGRTMGSPNGFTHTDLDNAERLIDSYGELLRYCHAEKRWYVYNGKYRSSDESGQAMRYAVDTVYSIENDDPDRARKSKSGPR
jgi:hypothetical protein